MDALNTLLSQLKILEGIRFDHMCEEIGHEPVSTFWTDFSIAEVYGDTAVRDTYRRAVAEWAEDVEYMAELTLVLNWKIWDLYISDIDMAKLYEELWVEHDNFCWETFKDDAARRYWEITD